MPVRNEDCQGQDLSVQWALGHLLSFIGIKNILHNVSKLHIDSPKAFSGGKTIAFRVRRPRFSS